MKRFSLLHHLQNEMCRKSGSNQRITKVLDCPTTGLSALTRGHLAPLYAPQSTCLPDKLDCRYLLLSGTRRGFMDSRLLQAIGYVTVALESPRRGVLFTWNKKLKWEASVYRWYPLKRNVFALVPRTFWKQYACAIKY